MGTTLNQKTYHYVRENVDNYIVHIMNIHTGGNYEYPFKREKIVK